MRFKELFMEYVSDKYIARLFVTLVALKLYCTRRLVEFLVLR